MGSRVMPYMQMKGLKSLGKTPEELKTQTASAVADRRYRTPQYSADRFNLETRKERFPAVNEEHRQTRLPPIKPSLLPLRARSRDTNRNSQTEFATGLRIGASVDKEAAQLKIERYRQDLLDQIAERQRIKQKENELKWKVVSPRVLDLKTEVQKSLEKVQYSTGTNRNDPVLSTAPTPTRKSLEDMRRRFHSRHGSQLYDTKEELNPYEEKPEVAVDDRGHGTPQHSTDRFNLESRKERVPTVNEDHHEEHRWTQLPPINASLLPLRAQSRGTNRNSQTEFATGLRIGASVDKEAAQLKIERYRQDLLDQIAERQRIKQKENELKWKVVSPRALDLNTEVQKSLEKVQYSTGTNRNDPVLSTAPTPTRRSLEDMRRRFHSRHGSQLYGTKEELNPYEEKPEVAVDDRGHGTPQHSTDRFNLESRKERVPTVNEDHHEEHRWTQLPPINASLLPLRAQSRDTNRNSQTEFATGLRIGASVDKEAAQVKIERYRQDLLDQIAERQKIKQKENELKWKVVPPGALDLKTEYMSRYLPCPPETDEVNQFGAQRRGHEEHRWTRRPPINARPPLQYGFSTTVTGTGAYPSGKHQDPNDHFPRYTDEAKQQPQIEERKRWRATESVENKRFEADLEAERKAYESCGQGEAGYSFVQPSPYAFKKKASEILTPQQLRKQEEYAESLKQQIEEKAEMKKKLMLEQDGMNYIADWYTQQPRKIEEKKKVIENQNKMESQIEERERWRATERVENKRFEAELEAERKAYESCGQGEADSFFVQPSPYAFKKKASEILTPQQLHKQAEYAESLKQQMEEKQREKAEEKKKLMLEQEKEEKNLTQWHTRQQKKLEEGKKMIENQNKMESQIEERKRWRATERVENKRFEAELEAERKAYESCGQGEADSSFVQPSPYAFKKKASEILTPQQLRKQEEYAESLKRQKLRSKSPPVPALQKKLQQSSFRPSSGEGQRFFIDAIQNTQNQKMLLQDQHRGEKEEIKQNAREAQRHRDEQKRQTQLEKVPNTAGVKYKPRRPESPQTTYNPRRRYFQRQLDLLFSNSPLVPAQSS
ncbi:hypothetical protein HF521_010580 [Silurus meridionalis]|uniref:Uncharacterized protein n=1 Tax=Silurus meridionalis TaxID=175797 RepID=A0A8T0AJ13_SILME|nr:hypothetical protein HF521_010580 [Silurus meridionalis]